MFNGVGIAEKQASKPSLKKKKEKTHICCYGSQQSALTFRHAGWNEAGEVITAADNLLTGFPVMSGGAGVITTFQIQHLTCDWNSIDIKLV